MADLLAEGSSASKDFRTAITSGKPKIP